MIQKGRICLEETAEALKIAIPVRKHFALLSLIIFVLAFWFAGGCFAAWDFTNTDGATSIFILFWLFGWALGMVYLGLILSWLLIGEEQVVIAGSELRLILKLPWFGWTRKHRLDWVREVSVNRESTPMLDPLKNLELWGIVGKSINIRYGYSSVRFGVRLDDAEKALVVDEINRRLGRQKTKEDG